MSRNFMPTVKPKQPCTATNQIDSPYASNLHTNYTPTELEILQIKEFLTDPLKRLSSLDAEIERVHSILDELRHERSALSDEIEAHRALISPIRRIPLDVLGEIFIHCLPEGRNAVMSSREAPILLGRICSAWRSIALSTPRLWASLHISTPMEISETRKVLAPPDPAFVAKMERRCEGAREWISRSGESPISISVCIPTHVFSYNLHPGSSMKTFEVAVAQILASSHRWKKVDFRATKDSFTRLQQLAEDDVPLLESLVIASGTLRTASAWDPLASNFGGRWAEFSGLLSARKLRKLSLSYLKGDLLSFSVRWSQLTHLNLDLDIPAQFAGTSSGLRYSDIIKVLRRCPLLVSCGLSLGSTAFDVVPQPDLPLAEYTLTLPLLENLLLNLSGRSDECHLKHLDLPRLRHLQIKFQGIFSRSPANILSMTRDELIGSLESVPLLTHLHVSSSSKSCSVVDPEVIDRLTPSAENPDYLCPMLEELQCNGTHCANFSESQLLSLVQRRSDSEKGGVLKRVDVTFQDRREPKNFDELLDSLIGIGMKVSQRNVAGAVIQPVSDNTKLSTVVNIKYAEWPLQDFFSPWDGQNPMMRSPGSRHFDFT